MHCEPSCPPRRQPSLRAASRSPWISDEVLATFRIAEDLERIGDLAKNIAKRATAVASSHFPEDIVTRLDRLSGLASEHLNAALETFIARDAERALIVRTQDEIIDALYTEVFTDLVSRLTADPDAGHWIRSFVVLRKKY